jgi:hypothetical protein
MALAILLSTATNSFQKPDALPSEPDDERMRIYTLTDFC